MKHTTLFLASIVLTLANGCDSSADNRHAQTHDVGESQCAPRIPDLPDPLPAGFDWRPVAESVCAGLASCGYPTAGCVDIYLKAVQSPPAESEPPAPKPAPVSHIVLSCESSDDFALNPDACAAATASP